MESRGHEESPSVVKGGMEGASYGIIFGVIAISIEPPTFFLNNRVVSSTMLFTASVSLATLIGAGHQWVNAIEAEAKEKSSDLDKEAESDKPSPKIEFVKKKTIAWMSFLAPSNEVFNLGDAKTDEDKNDNTYKFDPLGG